MTKSPRRQSTSQKKSGVSRAQLGDLTTVEISRLSRDTPLVFPVAALEQHGSHLPLITDTLLIGEIVRRAGERLTGQVVFAPVLWLGNSDHHLDFSGTSSAGPRTYLSIINDLAENFLRHGFKRIVFLNGHGGNDGPLKQATFEVRQRYRARDGLLLLAATYWNQADAAGLSKLGMRQTQMGHACEWETSMVLSIAPHLVGDYRRVKPTEQGGSFAFGTRAWVTQDRSKAGHIGQPHAATAEKGAALLQLFTDGVVRLLSRVVAWDGKSW